MWWNYFQFKEKFLDISEVVFKPVVLLSYHENKLFKWHPKPSWYKINFFWVKSIRSLISMYTIPFVWTRWQSWYILINELHKICSTKNTHLVSVWFLELFKLVVYYKCLCPQNIKERILKHCHWSIFMSINHVLSSNH